MHSNLMRQKNPAHYWLAGAMALMVFAGCKSTEGLINKVIYNHEMFVNTCQTFQLDVARTVESNREARRLDVAEYDNSAYNYFYLEPGQAEIRRDTLFFRLAQDLNYPKYLDFGVAVHVNLSSRTDSALTGLRQMEQNDLGTLVIDRNYYTRNRRPLFMYKFPLKGQSLAGRQLMLSFSIAQYDPKGALQSFFCETDSRPIGLAMPACCSAQPWNGAALQAAVDIPALEARAERYAYVGFTATFDVSFQENTADFPDSVLSLAAQSHIEKFRRLDYRLSRIQLTGYTSITGSEQKNLDLSARRASAVAEGLKKLNAGQNVPITAEGKGEDWLRIEELVQRNGSLSSEQKDEALAIVRQNLPGDEREARLRKLKFWQTLNDEVLALGRHTYLQMEFDYTGPNRPLGRIPGMAPLASRELEQMAASVFQVSPWRPGAGIESGTKAVDEVLRRKADANLYTIRAGYRLAQQDFEGYAADLRQAASLDPGNARYEQAIEAWRIRRAADLPEKQRRALLEAYNEQARKRPNDRELFWTRAILMDYAGDAAGAVREYEQLFEGYPPSASNYNNYGIALMRCGRLADGEAALQKAIELSPERGEPYFNLAVLYAWRGLAGRCLSMLEPAVQRQPAYRDLIFDNPAFSVVSKDPRFDKYR